MKEMVDVVAWTWNAISKPPTFWTVSYRELFPKDLRLDVELNGFYLNVTALVIVDYIACIDPKSYLIFRVCHHLSSGTL